MKKRNRQYVLAVAFLFVFQANMCLPSAAMDISIPVTEILNDKENARNESLTDFVHCACVFDSCCTPFLAVSQVVLHDPLNKAWLQETWLPSGGVGTMPGVVATTSGRVNANQLKAHEELMRLRRVRRELYASGGFDEAAEKRKIIEGLRTFGDTATYVPVVYATIWTTYGGDVSRYVDDLFERSAMTNRRRMMRVTRWPRKRRMQGDMGFQLSLSKQLYMAWEAMGRPSQLIGHFVIPNKWKK